MTTVEVLRAAREKLAKPGVWAKGNAVDTVAGRYCCSTATGEGIGEADRVFARAIGARNCTVGVYEWNDAPERTLEEVLAAFDRAIELEEAQ